MKKLGYSQAQLKRAKELLDARLKGLRAKELEALKAEEWRLAELAKKKARRPAPDDAVRLLEEALKALKTAPDATGQRRAVDALEAALKRLHEQNQPKKPLGDAPKKP